MRRLWIRREKASAACLAKMKVYIEDHESGDVLIQDIPCRKLGELKNDQIRHFAISEDAAKVFVVADKISRNTYCEFVRIPEGSEDVFLSGRNYFSPFSGNPFRFDGVTDEETLHNRKKVKRKGKLLLWLSILIGILIGAGIGAVAVGSLLSDMPEAASAMTFAVDEMRITLTDAFTETDVEGYAASYASSDVAVFVVQEEFSLMEGLADLSVEDYGNLVIDSNDQAAGVKLQSQDGLTSFAYWYSNPETRENYNYYTTLFKGPDAFWMVQFATTEELAQEYRQNFVQWAQTVAFSGV